MNELEVKIPKEHDERFKNLARKIRRRRVVVTAVLSVIVIILTIAIFNYKEAGVSAAPSIEFTSELVGTQQTSVRVYYSLGFKQVFYKSDYGKNYSQRLMLWENVDTNPQALTAVQYKQLMNQLQKKYSIKNEAEKYVEVFKSYDAVILDVVKEGHEYTIYLKGHLSSFIEYGGEVYPLWESEEEQPLIVTAAEKNDQLIIKNVTEYQLGDAGSEAIFEAFPKHLAMQMLSGTKGREDTIDIIKERSLLNAASHFGKPIAEEKELEIDIRTGEISVHLTIEEEQ